MISSLPEDTARMLEAPTGTSILYSPLIVIGRSGVRHSFTLGMKDPVSVVFACDVVVAPAPIDEIKVLSLYIKVYDVNADHYVLCAVPSLTPEAKGLAALYKMVVFEAPEKEQVFAKLPDILRELSKE
jgi:hypothetical protein